ncbi:hypothetical protein KPSA1_04657 [Pseudomonas syringae pv. actinidiae]|uniref:Uncharacterized protein n=1 Tax=Pseudomonas syringae pv. actinidiae TaxID=103796 RepID=A0A2V0QDX9_PSESF|nr:hypothetical protein KPSA1_04657 [Pseudomonas syringae pv. actinidiae]
MLPLPVSAIRSFCATVAGLGLDWGLDCVLLGKGLVIRAHSIFASMARNSSGNEVCQATCGDQPSQPVATA